MNELKRPPQGRPFLRLNRHLRECAARSKKQINLRDTRVADPRAVDMFNQSEVSATDPSGVTSNVR